ncbi:hypothetical protein [Bradyrhizobium arachidis]|uniref:hypothetical protein n=1 Tax=Bradyrhizobium arachidis TaxID=858423 RepID=UPI0021634D2F|nr:hypothetical protein [Bradyrhizobium arachidis]UVO28136.1 hypothetical protein KUF59_37635 [Bradyrhizobium arachidis]
MKYAILALGLLVTPAAAETDVTPSRQFMICSSVEHMLETCNESRINKTICNWIDPPGHAKGYRQMIADHWLSQKVRGRVPSRLCRATHRRGGPVQVLPVGVAQDLAQPGFKFRTRRAG